MSKYRMHLLALLAMAMWMVIITVEWNAHHPTFDLVDGSAPPLPQPIPKVLVPSPAATVIPNYTGRVPPQGTPMRP